MSTRPMSDAPRDGTRILLHYWVLFLPDGYECQRKRSGSTWAECRWVDDHQKTDNAPHWEPWCGKENHHTSAHIAPEDAIEWVPVPVSWGETVARANRESANRLGPEERFELLRQVLRELYPPEPKRRFACPKCGGNSYWRCRGLVQCIHPGCGWRGHLLDEYFAKGDTWPTKEP